MPYEISELDRQHARLMEKIAVMCRSEFGGQFTDESRLNAIRESLENTSYKEISSGSLYRMYGKIPVEKLPDACILVSAHVDTVRSIQNCHSSLDEETGVYTGTYDNAGPDAVEVILMQEEELPENIVFAFTGDEETGYCGGAKEAVASLIRAGKHPFCIALDVTYEGYDDNLLISVENLVPTPDVYAEPKVLKKIGNLLIGLEPEKTQTFRLVAKGENHIPKNLPQKYVADDYGMVDEAFAYAEMMCPTMSLCLPCGNGGMHSQAGVKIKAPVLEGYILSLASVLYKMSDYVKNLIYDDKNPVKEHHTQKLEAYKVARKNLVHMAAEIRVPRPIDEQRNIPLVNYNRPNFYQSMSVDEANRILDIYSFDENDLETLIEEAEEWGDKEAFVEYATVPDGMYEVLGLFPHMLSEEEQNVLRQLKEEVWDSYEKTKLEAEEEFEEDSYDSEYWEDMSDERNSSKRWDEFLNDDCEAYDNYDNFE